MCETWQVCDHKIMPQNQEMCYESKHPKEKGQLLHNKMTMNFKWI